MAYLNVNATRWVDDHFPGFVEIQFLQSDGGTITVIDKVPVVDRDNNLTPETRYPVPLQLDCSVLRVEQGEDGRQIARIELDYGVTDFADNAVFEVSVDLVGDLPDE